jgi:hypothetical protein
MKLHVAKIKAQEAFANEKWKENRNVAGQKFLINRKGKCGRPSMLTGMAAYMLSAIPTISIDMFMQHSCMHAHSSS